ncbi:MAG: hypothetical protein WB543_12915 [Candidatus Acidiferrum sp.]
MDAREELIGAALHGAEYDATLARLRGTVLVLGLAATGDFSFL